MWLLFKSKNQKINGGDLLKNKPVIADLLAYLTNVTTHKFNSSGVNVVNKYINFNFQQQLPENLPHISTWLLAAQAYIQISNILSERIIPHHEVKLITDIVSMGEQLQIFLTQLASNDDLWLKILLTMQDIILQIQARWKLLTKHPDIAFLLDSNSLYSIKPASKKMIFANSAPVDLQLEPFEPILVNITDLWYDHILKHLPQELVAAETLGLGSWHIEFLVDKQCNKFVDLHIPYSVNNTLPDYARDILFKLQISFKLADTQQKYLLNTAWFGYDLHDSARRLEEYYNNKFRQGLRHKKYCWISLDGTSNQVLGHGNTTTKKPIDYIKLAQMYKNSLQKSLPINDAALGCRILDNSIFVRERENLISKNHFMHEHSNNKKLLYTILPSIFDNKILQKRKTFAVALLEDHDLKQSLDKLAVYYAIIAIYAELLNLPWLNTNLAEDFAELIMALSKPQLLSANMFERLEQFFTLNIPLLDFNNEYLQGKLYKRLMAILMQLELLQTRAKISCRI